MHPSRYKHVFTANRMLSWLLLANAAIMMITGYAQTRLTIDRTTLIPLHTYLGYLFGALLLAHFTLSVFLLKYPWKTEIPKLLKGRTNHWSSIRIIQRISAWVLLVFGMIQFLSGLGWYGLGLQSTLSFSPHTSYDIFTSTALMIHVSVGIISALGRMGINRSMVNREIIILTAILLIGLISVDQFLVTGTITDRGRQSTSQTNETYKVPEDTAPEKTGEINIGKTLYGTVKTVKFNPEEVQTLRPDIFKPGYFSMFDILVHISKKGEVDLEYHFEDSMNTYVIDRLEGDRYWWYEAYYHGGWSETNYFRADHYPWKDKTTLTFFRVSKDRLDETYSIFREESQRFEANKGKIVIPQVKISGLTKDYLFENVEVHPHNLRNDIFQKDVISAIDVILSLGEQEDLNYGLQWYESIGTAMTVKNYWVETIGPDTAEGRCGFVYESGSLRRKNRYGNHLHIPSDTRVLNSPEYVWYFWICI